MKRKDNPLRLKEVLRFLVGGGSAVAADYVVYMLLLSGGWQVSMAKAVSYVCGAAVGFVINKQWTFESPGFSGMEIMRYILLYAGSACANAAVNRGVLAVVPVRGLGFLCATACSTVLNFLGQKFFVFAKKEQGEQRGLK